MSNSKINTVTMSVEAYSKEQALDIAHQANQNMFEGKLSFFLVEEEYFGDWLVILADNEQAALQAQEKYYEDE